MTNKPQQARPADPSFSVGATAGRGPALSSLPATAPYKWRVLGVYCRTNELLDLGTVHRRLTPMQTRPFRNVAEYRAWLATKTSAPKRTSQAVRRLAIEGYLMPVDVPRLDLGSADAYRYGGWDAVAPLAYAVDMHGDMVRARRPDTLRERFRRAIVSVLADNPDGVQYAALL